jgi:hypothetical protein
VKTTSDHRQSRVSKTHPHVEMRGPSPNGVTFVAFESMGSKEKKKAVRVQAAKSSAAARKATIARKKELVGKTMETDDSKHPTLPPFRSSKISEFGGKHEKALQPGVPKKFTTLVKLSPPLETLQLPTAVREHSPRDVSASSRLLPNPDFSTNIAKFPRVSGAVFAIHDRGLLVAGTQEASASHTRHRCSSGVERDIIRIAQKHAPSPSYIGSEVDLEARLRPTSVQLPGIHTLVAGRLNY